VDAPAAVKLPAVPIPAQIAKDGVTVTTGIGLIVTELVVVEAHPPGAVTI
jgi:hypothetical protein